MEQGRWPGCDVEVAVPARPGPGRQLSRPTSCPEWGAAPLLPGAVSQPSSTTARMAAAKPMSQPRTVLTLVREFMSSGVANGR